MEMDVVPSPQIGFPAYAVIICKLREKHFVFGSIRRDLLDRAIELEQATEFICPHCNKPFFALVEIPQMPCIKGGYKTHCNYSTHARLFLNLAP
jgi:hypothetical protein